MCIYILQIRTFNGREIWTGSGLEAIKGALLHIHWKAQLAKAKIMMTDFFSKKQNKQKKNTFIRAAAALRLMTATESRFRRLGSRLSAERELENEQSDAVPGVRGVCGALSPSTSSTVRKARPRARGSTICAQTQTQTHTFFSWQIQR